MHLQFKILVAFFDALNDYFLNNFKVISANSGDYEYYNPISQRLVATSDCTECSKDRQHASPAAYLVYLVDLLTTTTNINDVDELEETLFQDIKNVPVQEEGVESYVKSTNDVLINYIINDKSEWIDSGRRNRNLLNIYNNFSASAYPYPKTISELFDRLIREFDLDEKKIRALRNASPVIKDIYSDRGGIDRNTFDLIALEESDINYAKYLELKEALKSFISKKAEVQIQEEEILKRQNEILNEFFDSFSKKVNKEIDDNLESALIPHISELNTVEDLEALENGIGNIRDSVAACIIFENRFCPNGISSSSYPIIALEELFNQYGVFNFSVEEAIWVDSLAQLNGYDHLPGFSQKKAALAEELREL